MRKILKKEFQSSAPNSLELWLDVVGPSIEIVGKTERPYRMQTRRGSFKETNTTITTIYYKETQ